MIGLAGRRRGREAAGGLLLTLAWVCLLMPATAKAEIGGGTGRITYSIKTGIYTVAAGGGSPQLIIPWHPSTCGPACTDWKVPRNPSYSPNGQLLAYDVETTIGHHGVTTGAQDDTRVVYVANANGTDIRRIGWGHDPEFSPDGKSVIYLVNENQYPPSTVEQQQNSPNPLGDDYGPLEEVNLKTGTRTRLPGDGAAEFSPNAQQMLSYRQVNLSSGTTWVATIANVNGTDPVNYELPMFYTELPRFVAGGQVSYDCPSVNHQQPDICLLNPRTRRSHRLFHVNNAWALEAGSSPNGRWFTVATLQGLYIVDARGGHAREIVNNGSGADYVNSGVPESPVWQPSP